MSEEEKTNTSPKKGSNKPEISYEERVANVNKASKPLSSRKQTKKIYKLVSKTTKARKMRRGVREVVKSIRKGMKGICVLAGDVSPIDVISHIPVYCEQKDIPYIFVPSRRDLGGAALSKRPTSAILITTPEKDVKYKELFDKVFGEIGNLQN